MADQPQSQNKKWHIFLKQHIEIEAPDKASAMELAKWYDSQVEMWFTKDRLKGHYIDQIFE